MEITIERGSHGYAVRQTDVDSGIEDLFAFSTLEEMMDFIRSQFAEGPAG